MIRRLSAFLSLVAGFAASAVGAQTPPANLPPAAVTFPPPSPMNEEGVKAWVAQYIDTAGWRLVGADPAAASFLLAQAPPAGSDGLVANEVRREYFGAPQLGPNGARSVRQAWIVDCKAQKVWVRQIMLFSENNLKGATRGRESSEPRWTEVSSGSINEKLMTEICAATTRAEPAPANSPT